MKNPTLKLTAQTLRDLPPAKAKEVLSKLTVKQAEELRYNWKFWARPNQLEPQEKDWNVWLINAGRGYGKTRAGAEWVREQVKQGAKRIAVVTRTGNDHEKTVVNGESGLMSLCYAGDKTYSGQAMGMPYWSSTKKTLKWENGATAFFFSAEEPDGLRGPQFHCAWADELAAWNNQQMAWDMLKMTVRLPWKGKNKYCVTTTPQSTPLIRSLVAQSKTRVLEDGTVIPRSVVITSGSTFENKANLSEEFVKDLVSSYEGTRLGRQELYAEILTENEGSLWTLEMVDASQVDLADVPTLVRKIIAVDPAVSANVESDMTGIIYAGIDINGIVYILGDYTMKALPEVWGKKAAELFYEFDCDRLIYESNQGKDMIPPLFRVVDENIPLKGVHASTNKIARAEPVSALYERGKVKHVRNPSDPKASLVELETQMTTYEPMGKQKSPDRYDAMVWAVTELALKGYAKPELKLAYSNAKGLGNK